MRLVFESVSFLCKKNAPVALLATRARNLKDVLMKIKARTLIKMRLLRTVKKQ